MLRRRRSIPEPYFKDPSRYAWLAAPLLFLALAAILPGLDREREYYDMQAVYRAIKDAAGDVMDVLLLHACFDALLFCLVIDCEKL